MEDPCKKCNGHCWGYYECVAKEQYNQIRKDMVKAMTGKELIEKIFDIGMDKEIVIQRASMLMEIKPFEIVDEYGKIVIKT